MITKTASKNLAQELAQLSHIKEVVEKEMGQIRKFLSEDGEASTPVRIVDLSLGDVLSIVVSDGTKLPRTVKTSIVSTKQEIEGMRSSLVREFQKSAKTWRSVSIFDPKLAIGQGLMSEADLFEKIPTLRTAVFKK